MKSRISPPDVFSFPARRRPPVKAEVFNNETLRTGFVLAGEARMGKPDSSNHNETLVRD